MIRSKQGLKALGLCLMGALSLMAVTAAGAQAHGDWFINGVKTTKTEKVTGVVDTKDVTLSGEILGKNIKVICQTLAVSDGLLFHPASEPSGLGKLAFSNCATNVDNIPSGVCDVEDEPIVATVKALLILHNSKTYILFSPDDGTLTFTKIRFGKLVNNECPFGPLIPVTGHAIAQCVQSGGVIGCEKEENTHLIEEVPNVTALFPSKDGSGKFIHQLRFGTSTATLTGGAVLSLPDHPGETWSGLGL